MPADDMTTTLMLGVLFGAVGMGYIVYGRKQRQGVALLSGIGLCVLPYVIPGAILLAIVGVVLMALPFWLRY
jgi:hypothetical protein